MDDRAQREREQYNAGLQRDTYDRYLNPSKIWFMEKRRERALELFNQHRGGAVLELGSATWFTWIERNNIEVGNLTCINISEAELDEGKSRAKNAKNKPDFRLMDAQDLAFEDNSFDIVFGSAILHHLDFERSLLEIKRVLKPGGVMFFAEPLDMNPVGRLVRRLTPRARTEDERPFRMYEFKKLNQHFDCRYVFEGLVSVPVGVLSAFVGLPSKNGMTKGAFQVDRVLGRVPGLRYMCRHVFLEGRVR